MSVKYTNFKGTKLQIVFPFMCACVVCMWIHHVCTVPEEAGKRVLDPLGLEL